MDDKKWHGHKPSLFERIMMRLGISIQGCVLLFLLTLLVITFAPVPESVAPIRDVVSSVLGIGFFAILLFGIGSMFIDILFKREHRISKDLLVRKTTLEEIESGISEYFRDNKAWSEFISNLQEGDEIWTWETSPWTIQFMVGRGGYVIIRNGEVTTHSITTGMS